MKTSGEMWGIPALSGVSCRILDVCLFHPGGLVLGLQPAVRSQQHGRQAAVHWPLGQDKLVFSRSFQPNTPL